MWKNGPSAPRKEVIREGSLGEVKQSLDGAPPKKEMPFSRGWGPCKQLWEGDKELASCSLGQCEEEPGFALPCLKNQRQ